MTVGQATTPPANRRSRRVEPRRHERQLSPGALGVCERSKPQHLRRSHPSAVSVLTAVASCFRQQRHLNPKLHNLAGRSSVARPRCQLRGATTWNGTATDSPLAPSPKYAGTVKSHEDSAITTARSDLMRLCASAWLSAHGSAHQKNSRATSRGRPAVGLTEDVSGRQPGAGRLRTSWLAEVPN